MGVLRCANGDVIEIDGDDDNDDAGSDTVHSVAVQKDRSRALLSREEMLTTKPATLEAYWNHYALDTFVKT